MTPAKREKCREQIHGNWTSWYCPRYAVQDGYCKQHHPESVKTRRAASEAKWDAKVEAARLARNEQARETVRAFLGWSKWTITEVTERALVQWEQEPK